MRHVTHYAPFKCGAYEMIFARGKFLFSKLVSPRANSIKDKIGKSKNVKNFNVEIDWNISIVVCGRVSVIISRQGKVIVYTDYTHLRLSDHTRNFVMNPLQLTVTW